jgi:SAM-dependent methyltransferase
VRSELVTQWKKDEAAVFEGWDFSYIKDRYLEEEPTWDYKALAKQLIKSSASVLDIATGGGEVFSSLAPFPVHAVAIEGYRPNVAVARKRLGPLGAQVLEGKETPLPFEGSAFDLVLNRHGGLDVAETYRVLQENGKFLTQQVGGGNLIELMDSFDVKEKWPDNTLKIVRQKMQDVGFHIERAEEWKGKVKFLDIGAVVYFLKAIPWIVDNFSVDSHLEYLRKLQENLEREGKLEFTYARFLVFARK